MLRRQGSTSSRKSVRQPVCFALYSRHSKPYWPMAALGRNASIAASEVRSGSGANLQLGGMYHVRFWDTTVLAQCPTCGRKPAVPAQRIGSPLRADIVL